MVRDAPRPRTLPLAGVLAAVVGVTALLMVVAALQGVPRFGDIALQRRPPASAPPTASQRPDMPGGISIPDSPVLGTIVAVIEILFSLAMLFLLLWLFWRVLRVLWQRRPLSRQAGGEVGIGAVTTAGDEAVDAGTIRAAALDARQAIDAHRDPADAIVAAWVHLEEASARAGRARAPSETPAEFTMRILRRRPGLDAELGALLGLYESVRFGGREADEAQRATARRCLAAIEEGWR